ncbi:IS630 family transposase [Paraburkholderia fungorum]|uniref:IS630 family transposase n=1 Tax=Paraburkholderia fungorum TaxID=134537 RepID=A0AAP5UXS5_9BURK|nr:IS630 family transposase [Paraburkholderia fungorum]MDT8843300.1 IS630 family transposase [Paraburkholderia fungorum]
MTQRRLSEAAKKRLKAGRLLLSGKGCAEVALAVGVARQTVYTWKRLLDEGGIDALREVPERGRPAQLDEQQLAAVRATLLQSPTEHGFGTELWTLKRVGAVIERVHGIRFSQTQVWRILGSLGFSPQKPEKRAIERNEDAVRNWKRRTWPALKKKPRRESRLIVFVDESGISERPTRVRTWAPKGQTPIIQFHFNWNHVSVIAGLTRTNCLFRLHEGSIKKEEIVEFLKALKAHLKQPLLVIWDGLKAHRSRLVREYLDSLDGHIQIAFLPPYAPDMNPVEYLWAWLKRHALANYCPNDLGELHASARNKFKSAQKRPSIIAACWIQATLW